MRSCYARSHRSAGEGQVRNARRRVRPIDGDICIAAAGREAEILRSADIIGTPPVREAEDAAVVRLAFVLEGQRVIAVGRPVYLLRPAPQVHASGNTTDGDDVGRALGIDAVA